MGLISGVMVLVTPRDACGLVRDRRILSDAVTRLNGALEGRYAIERELGEGSMATRGQTRHQLARRAE